MNKNSVYKCLSSITLVLLCTFFIRTIHVQAASTTVTFEQGLNGYTGVADTIVDMQSWGNPQQFTLNFGQSNYLEINRDGRASALLSFNLSSIPISATVQSAVLKLYNYTNSSVVRRVNVFAVLKKWDEGTQNGTAITSSGQHGATANNAFSYYQNEGTNSAWGASGMQAGTDFQTVPIGYMDVSAPGFYQVTLNSQVQSWIANPSSNFGIVLRDASGYSGSDFDVRDFYSSQYSDSTLRPQLILSYDATGATPSVASPDILPPSIPGTPTGISSSPSQINLSWASSTDNVGVTGYIIYRNGVQIAKTVTASYQDTSLAASTDYTYTVAAFDAAGNVSSQSASVIITTQDSLLPNANTSLMPIALPCVPGSGHDYEVGPNSTYKNIGDVPWKNVGPGDTIRVHARSTPYYEKVTIRESGTASAYIKFCGIPDPTTGALPIIDGQNAVSSSNFSYSGYMPLQPLGLITINQSYGSQAQYIDIENFIVRGAKAENTFTDSTGVVQNYNGFGSAFHITAAAHIIIRNNVITDSGNGIFSTSASNDIANKDFLIEGNHIYGNGDVNSFSEHDIYTEVVGIVFQYNLINHERSGAGGSCLKDRSAGTVIRYNWIEGCARTLDLVEPQDPAPLILPEPSFGKTYVYGNVLLYNNPKEGRTFVHYGGDQGGYDSYRKGTLYFYNNTVVSLLNDQPSWGPVEVFRVDAEGTPSQQGTVEAWNNIFYSGTTNGSAPATIDFLGVNWLDGGEWGNLHMGKNIVSPNWNAANPHDPFKGTFVGTSTLGIIPNNNPGFISTNTHDFHLTSDSPSINIGGTPPAGFDPTYAVSMEYVPDLKNKNRLSAVDAGAFSSGSLNPPNPSTPTPLPMIIPVAPILPVTPLPPTNNSGSVSSVNSGTSGNTIVSPPSSTPIPIPVISVQIPNNTSLSSPAHQLNLKFSSVRFNRNLHIGLRRIDVKYLQKFLNMNGYIVAARGIGSSGKESTYFGIATKRALIKFQKAQHIFPSVGFFGILTRTFINSIR